jgi:uncharacterized membrane protein
MKIKKFGTLGLAVWLIASGLMGFGLAFPSEVLLDAIAIIAGILILLDR